MFTPKRETITDEDRRKHRRFRSTAFLGIPLYLTPVPPYFGASVEGQVIDLSASGMAILIPESLPLRTELLMHLTFPDRSVLTSPIVVRRTTSCTGGYLTGIEFLQVTDEMMTMIDQMADDFADCEERILANAPDICRLDCAFLKVCDKSQKKAYVRNLDQRVRMKLTPIP